MTGTEKQDVSSSALDPEHLQLENVFPQGPAVFFQSSDSYHSGINVWGRDVEPAPASIAERADGDVDGEDVAE